MKIALTGGTGFIGQWLLKLYADEHSFVVLSAGGCRQDCFRHPNVTYIQGTYTEEEMERAFAGCDALAHLGAALSIKEREIGCLGYADNLASAEAVFAAARKLGITNVVNISSRTVYDHAQEGPYMEDTTVPAPMNDYALSKLAIEHSAALHGKRYGLRVKSLRLAQVFGPGGRAGYMMEIFRQKCEEKEALTVFDRQGKELLYVKDAARAILCACLQPQEAGVYNIGSGVFATNADIAQAFCKVYENGAGYTYAPDASDQKTVRTCMDVTKAARALHFTAAYTLEEAIRDMRAENGTQKKTAGENNG